MVHSDDIGNNVPPPKNAIQNKKGRHWLLFYFITFESVVVDVENGRRQSIKRLVQEYDSENVKYIYISY